ncbi:multifunctional CCA addition/repair protein [Gammaproteobacteria bacterium]|nr:multifunctional CCA addition/repair protein [Gammaproteobacteria bacterium]
MSDPSSNLKCYLVGGAVRDRLLGLPETDRDWVVIGHDASEMIRLGFRQVGKDFPVFLHPLSGEEYALARRERKIASGYAGFSTDSNRDVTLEEDLSRRDLTINAIARDHEGTLIDPHNGQKDIEQRTLRHVSAAFTEDPLRVLRVARFAARYHSLNFKIAPETLCLMKEISASGELDSLSPERVWQETLSALSETAPAEFFRVLAACGALKHIFPEIAALQGIPQRSDFHPEGDAYVHTLMVIEAATSLTSDTRVRFSALVHDLGKALTPKNQWPRHIRHEQRGLSIINRLCDRLRIASEYRDIALLVSGQHLVMHRLTELRPETILKLLNKLDAFRRPDRLSLFAMGCHADAQGRGDGSMISYRSRDLLKEYFRVANEIDLTQLRDAEISGAEKKMIVAQKRLEAIIKYRDATQTPKSA